MFTSIKDFLTVWNDEAALTSKVFRGLTDASLSQAIDADHRTIGRIAWHIAQTVPEMPGKLGLTIDGPGEHDPVPATAKAIMDGYATAAASLPKAIAAAKWTDAILGEEREMYGEKWTVEFTLRAFIFHQIHHRGQLTVLMRQAGVAVPGIYGPTKEGWAQWGMKPPEV